LFFVCLKQKDCYSFFLLGITQTTKNKNIQPFNADDYNDNSRKKTTTIVPKSEYNYHSE